MIRKEEIKLSVFTEEMVAYEKITKESKKFLTKPTRYKWV